MARPDGPQVVPFDLVREAWNEYTFSDHVIVKIRLILTAVLQEYDYGPLSFETKKVTSVSAPDDLRGVPGEFEQGSNENVPRFECPILLRDERWNEYSLRGDSRLVKIVFVASRAFRLLRAFDKFGQPVYCVDGRPLIKSFEDVSEPGTVSASFSRTLDSA